MCQEVGGRWLGAVTLIGAVSQGIDAVFKMLFDPTTCLQSVTCLFFF